MYYKIPQKFMNSNVNLNEVITGDKYEKFLVQEIEVFKIEFESKD